MVRGKEGVREWQGVLQSLGDKVYALCAAKGHPDHGPNADHCYISLFHLSPLLNSFMPLSCIAYVSFLSLEYIACSQIYSSEGK